MAEMMGMGRPEEPIGSSFEEPFGELGAGSMFTVVKARVGITSYEDPGPYKHPPGTVAEAVAS